MENKERETLYRNLPLYRNPPRFVDEFLKERYKSVNKFMKLWIDTLQLQSTMKLKKKFQKSIPLNEG